MKEDFLQFENDLKLFEHNIYGFYYWNYIRFEVFKLIFSNTDVQKESRPSFNNILYMIKLAFCNNTIFIRGHRDIVASGFPRKITVNEKKLDPYVEYLVSHSDYSSVILERYHRVYHNEPSKNQKCYYLEDAEILCKVHEKLIKPTVKQKITSEVDYIVKIVNDYYGKKINSNILENKIVKSYSIWRVYTKKYKRLFKRLTPKCVIETPGYADHNQVMNEVATEFGIPSIEIEHGWIMPGNIPNNVSWDKPVSSFPDYIFVYSNYQKELVNFYQDKDHVKVVGWPYFDELISSIKKKEKNSDSKKTILVLGNIAYLGTEILKFTVILAKYMENNKLFEQYRIIYKSHPTDNGKESVYQPLRNNPNIELIFGVTNKSAHDCMRESDIAISSVTSTLYEAKGFGLQVFVINTPEAKMMKPFVDKGFAKLIETPEEVFSEDYQNQDLWPKNSLSLSQRELDRIINNSDSRNNN